MVVRNYSQDTLSNRAACPNHLAASCAKPRTFNAVAATTLKSSPPAAFRWAIAFLEGLGDVVGVHVVHKLDTEPGDVQWPPRECPPDLEVEVADRSDRCPTRPDDVPGVQRRRHHTARAGLPLEHPGDPILLDAVCPERFGAFSFGDGHSVARPVAPQGAAVQEVAHLAAQPLHEGGGRLESEAHQVDDDVGTQPRYRVTEDALGVFLLAVGDHMLYLLPLGDLGVRHDRPG